MPITPSYTWRETTTSVIIDVSLRSVSSVGMDIITTECYVKVNCKPYLFQVDLYGCINTQKSSAILAQNMVKFSLVKKEEGMWDRLASTDDRNIVLERREQSLAAARELADKKLAEASAKFSQIGRRAVESQIKLEEAKHKMIAVRKSAELERERVRTNSKTGNITWRIQISEENKL